MFNPTIIPALNASLSLLSSLAAVPAPTDPDLWECNGFFAHPQPPDMWDCYTAMTMMPAGPGPVGFTIDPIQGKSWTSGICEIVLYKSGQEYQQSVPFAITGDTIRQMALYVIQKCVSGVSGYQNGGYVTKYLDHTTDYLTAPDTVFPGPMPASTIYLSLIVWNRRLDAEDEKWNAGNFDPLVGSGIHGIVDLAAHEAPPGSTLQEDLQGRSEYILRAIRDQSEGREFPWWGPPLALLPPTLAGFNASPNALNLTESSYVAGGATTSKCRDFLAIARRKQD